MTKVKNGVIKEGNKMSRIVNKIGEIYLDCALHPTLCEGISVEDDYVEGVSLIDGTRPRSCSLACCYPVRLSVTEALEWIIAWKTGGDKAAGDKWKKEYDVMSTTTH